MKKLIFFSLILSVCGFNTAFAQNLGVLSDQQKPQKLAPVNDFLNFLSSVQNIEDDPEHQSPANLNSQHRSHESNVHGWGGRHYYWPSYYPTYYYPTYYYPYYYGYGYYPYYYYSDDGQTSDRMDRSQLEARLSAGDRAPTDAAHAPVVCFASDSAGTWFAQADVAQNVAQIQESVNQECREHLSSGANCTHNLGCALVSDSEN